MLKHLAGGILGVAILVWVAIHTGPVDGEVVVHVTEPDVEVSVGGRTYRIEEQRYDPIVCRLPPGWYELIMVRHNRVLHRETFAVYAGTSRVLTALDPNRERADLHRVGLGEGSGMRRDTVVLVNTRNRKSNRSPGAGCGLWRL